MKTDVMTPNHQMSIANPSLGVWFSLELNPAGGYATVLNDFSTAYDTFGFKGGFNAQNIIETATLDAITNHTAFPTGSVARAWMDTYSSLKADEIAAAKGASPTAKLIYETDLVTLPKSVIQMYAKEVVDPATGRVSIDMPMTLPLVEAMLDEVIGRFPSIDGFQIRVGEVNTLVLPYHAGSTAVDFALPVVKQQAQYVKLIRFLRRVVCVKHGRYLVFRTWDTAGFTVQDPMRFHGSLQYYLNVTEQIEAHKLLYFSVKHTRLDFWRYTQFNPVLNAGSHAQVIEVESEREYEGKGAHPNYVASGIIDGFPELRAMRDEGRGGTSPASKTARLMPIGLADLQAAGAFNASRGGRIRGLRIW
jgi:hypothetical protein